MYSSESLECPVAISTSIPCASDVRGDYLLHGHLYDFREISGNRLAVRVAFEFELRDSKTGSTVWTRYYSHDEPVDGKDVAAVVAALNRNVLSGFERVKRRTGPVFFLRILRSLRQGPTKTNC